MELVGLGKGFVGRGSWSWGMDEPRAPASQGGQRLAADGPCCRAGWGHVLLRL